MLPSVRVGQGYDVHRLVEDRALILGGVKIEYEKGLLGHSDADVLIHAICDSLLGAAALGDIGKHFPDSDERFRGVDSRVLLSECRQMLHNAGFMIGNIDATVIAQNPKLAPYIDKMRENISQVLGIQEKYVSIKATTEERLGFTGSGQGIAAQAVSLVYEIPKDAIFV